MNKERIAKWVELLRTTDESEHCRDSYYLKNGTFCAVGINIKIPEVKEIYDSLKPFSHGLKEYLDIPFESTLLTEVFFWNDEACKTFAEIADKIEKSIENITD